MRTLFDRMKIKMTTDEFEAFFTSIDVDGSGEISYPEFKMEFDRITNADVEGLIALHDQKLKVSSMKTSTFSSQPLQPSGANLAYMGTDEVKQSTKIAIHEAKEK